MNKLIIIIHSSEIIRKGLAAILRSFFVTEILQLESLHALDSYREMKHYSLVIITESAELSNNELLKTIQNNNSVNLVHFNNHNQSIGQVPKSCEYSIDINSSAIAIQETISGCLKTGEKVSRQPENDELTTREKEVLRLVALGHSNKIIADKLFISIHTVISHRKNISEKTGIKSISGLTVYAILNNLIDTKTINPDHLI